MKNNKKPVQSVRNTGNTNTRSNVYEMQVVASKKAAEAREGTFTHQLALLAKKPIVLGKLIEKVAASPDGQRVKRNPTEKKAVATVRVRQALTRFKDLVPARKSA